MTFNEAINLKKDTLIYHKRFGKGKIIRIEKSKDEVDFSKRAKNISLTFDETFVGFGPIRGKTDITRSMRNDS
jgi:transcription elongation factor GreA-like protein